MARTRERRANVAPLKLLLVHGDKLTDVGPGDIGARREPGIERRAREAHIPRADVLTDVAAEQPVTDLRRLRGSEFVAMLDRELPLEPIDRAYRGEVAARYRYKDGGGEIGVISSVTQPFCADCTRARLSADGSLYTCLFATKGHDLRGLVRSGASDEEITGFISDIWRVRTDRYSDLRSSETAGLHKIEMSFIGG